MIHVECSPVQGRVRAQSKLEIVTLRIFIGAATGGKGLDQPFLFSF